MFVHGLAGTDHLCTGSASPAGLKVGKTHVKGGPFSTLFLRLIILQGEKVRKKLACFII